MAINDACVAGIVCNHARARHSTAAQVSPIQRRNSELAARSSQKLACSACREIANISATSSTISTIASTARDSQKLGRNRVGDGPRESGAAAATAAASGSRLVRVGCGGEQRIFEVEQRRDVLVAVPLLDQPPVVQQRHF